MATTLTTVTPLGSRFPYIGIQDTQVQPIPLAELLFTFDGTITAAAAGEDQQFIITCVLPEGFAYVMAESTLILLDTETDDIDNWSSSIRAELSNGTSGTPPARWRIQQAFNGDAIVANTSTLKTRSYTLTNPSSKVIIPIPGQSGRFTAIGMTQTIDQGPMTLRFFAKVLEFHLSQAHHWVINTPWPVR